MSVLNDRLLKENFSNQFEKLNPGSIDLSLSNFVRRAQWYWRLPEPLKSLYVKFVLGGRPDPWDKKNESILWADPIRIGTIFSREGWYWLKKGELVLLSSKQYITIPENMAGLLVTTSTTGRVGLNHSHSGWLDPGFEGHVTFEYVSLAEWDIPLYAGRVTVQVVIFTLEEAALLGYSKTGRYNKQSIIPQGAR